MPSPSELALIEQNPPAREQGILQRNNTRNGNPVRLVVRSAGYEPAGSGVRLVNAAYGVTWDAHGSIPSGGRYYPHTPAGYNAASLYFDQLTKPPAPATL